jgi:cardiolipin synthase
MEASYWMGGAVAVLGGALALTAAGHALLYKRMPQSAFGWIAICIMLPLIGAMLYFLFGINRVRRRAQALRGDESHHRPPAPDPMMPPAELIPLGTLAERVSRLPLLGGNRVAALHNGEAAYPAMLKAIESAEQRVFLSSYIFDTSEIGQAFAAALGAAASRGVCVRVLLDSIGELHSWPRARRLLDRSGVSVGRFIPPRLLPPSLHVNLRNHRKILVVDGKTAFTGGINISDRYLAENISNPHRVIDIHFGFDGPVAAQMEAVFLDDWSFVTGESLEVSASPEQGDGVSLCRAVADGPDRELGKLHALICGAAALARKKLTIMTPYFLPTRELIGLLQTAALRGVAVDVILPSRNNLPYLHRATRHMLWELLERDVRVFYQPAPFVHSKLFLVDGEYALVGSANLDPRSLRLNFELNVEIYDRALVAHLEEHCQDVCSRSDLVTLAEVDRRPLRQRLVDGAAWIVSPYL